MTIAFLEHIKEVPEHRRPGMVTYRLDEILGCSDLAAILGVQEERQAGDGNRVSWQFFCQPAQAANLGQAGGAPISSRRGARGTIIPAEQMPSSTGRDALAATPRQASSGKKEKPLQSARRPASGTVDKKNALPTVPEENRNSRSGHLLCYQNRPSK